MLNGFQLAELLTRNGATSRPTQLNLQDDKA